MKKTKVLVYRDQQFEAETMQGVTNALETMQSLVDEFNSLKLGNIQPNELEKLVRTPQRVYDERLMLIEVPKGLQRAKYLALMDLPDIAPVMKKRNELLNSPFAMSFELFYLENQTVKVNDKELTNLLNSQNIYLDEGSPAFEFITGLTGFCRFYNELNQLSSFELLNPTNPLKKWFEVQQIEASYTKYRLVIDREKMMRLIKLWETTVKNT